MLFSRPAAKELVPACERAKPQPLLMGKQVLEGALPLVEQGHGVSHSLCLQSGYRRPWRSSIKARTAAIVFSSSAILRKIAVEGRPGCRAPSSIKVCWASLRRASNDGRSAEGASI